MKLSDNTILHLVRLLQVALISGTDIVDYLRQLELESNEDGILNVSQQSTEVLNKTIDDMLAQQPGQDNTDSE